MVHHNAAGGNGYDYAESVSIDLQGRLVVTGRSYNAMGNYDMVIWKFD